jgi:WS/DGAT/MGAT family acyltransferase
MVRERLSSMDSALLRLEEPTNLMMVTGVVVLGAPLDYARLRATIEDRLLRFDRFRQRAVRPRLSMLTPYWEDDPCLDLGYHLRLAALPPPGDRAALQEAASLLASTQLDPSRPLWQFHLIEEYGAGSALICRFHHSIADGMALVHVLLSLTDPEPGPTGPTPALREPEQAVPRGLGLCSRIQARRRVARRLARGGLYVLARRERLRVLIQRGKDTVTSLLGLAVPSSATATVLSGQLGVRKRAAWSDPLPLEEVKEVGRRLDGTVNDLMLAAVTGALRRYLQDRGERVDGVVLRAAIPVNLRRPGTEDELGNQIGAWFVPLPVGMADPADRFQALKRHMDERKRSWEAPLVGRFLSLIGRTTTRARRTLFHLFATKITAVMTNVMGPGEKIYLASAPIESLLFWVPKTGPVGLGVSVLSYAGQVRLGVITDQGLVPDPEALVAAFEAEYDALAALSREAEDKPTLEATLALLDEALVKLDRMLEDRGGEPAPPARCQALTKAGRPCKNRPLAGSSYCRVHRPTQDEPG